MLARWTGRVIHWRLVVVGAWLIVLVLGLFCAAKLPGLLTTSLNVPNSSSQQANRILEQHFGEDIEGAFTVVVPLPNTSSLHVATIEKGIASAAASVRTATVVQDRIFGHLLYANIDTTLNLQRAAAATPTLRGSLARQGLRGALVTGPPALQYDISPVLSSDLHRGELIALILALVLLALVLGISWALLIPFAVALSTSAASLAVIYLLAQHFLMVLYIPNVVELIGLGLAIDYSLLMVHRFRTEVEDGSMSVASGIERTMATAGRTVVISGGAFAIGLVTMLLVPVPFVRSLGAAGLVVPVVSIAAALTLQPALLSLFGRRGVQTVGYRGLMTPRGTTTGAWGRIARAVVRRPVATLVVSLVILLAAGTSIFWLQITPGSITAIPAHLQSSKALALTRHDIGPGIIAPTEVVIDSGGAHQVNTRAMKAARLQLAEAILRIPEVNIVAADSKPPYVDATGRYARIIIVNRHDFGSEATQHFVRELRDVIIPKIKFPNGTAIYLGGAAAQGVDFLSTVYGAFPWIVVLALILASVILIRAFRSLLLALVAVVLDLISVGVAYGFLVLIFRFGVGSSVLHTYHVSQIEGWVPIFIFAMLFGLSMDYEVFIVTRMREAWDRGSNTSDAIIEGLTQTGSVVSSAAVILVGALAGLVFGHVAGLQELGVGLALGVLVDATIVRGLLLPSVMTLSGKWNWWLPVSVARAVHLSPSPLENRGARG